MSSSTAQATSNPNNLELNKGDQFIIGLDISASMQANDCPGNLSRFNYALETCKLFVREANKWDPDGISFYPFGAICHAYRDLQPDEIDTKIAALKFEGATMTHLAIDAAYAEHKEKGNEQTFFLLFTDGEPSDHDAVKNSIIKITNDVKDEKEFRIGFITVGVRPASLEQYLTDLDDNLKSAGAKYDIVSVNRLEDVDFMGEVMSALNG